MKFTNVEIRDLIISSLVIAFLFSFSNLTVVSFLIALALVSPTFVLHELAHKWVAIKKGCIAHYVLWPVGVVFSIILTFISFGKLIFAAVGAVSISSIHPSRVGYKYVHLGREDVGHIAIAGPLTNFGLAIIGYLFSFISPIFSYFGFINSVIGLFNMIPFPPLDGIKVFGWSWIAWLLATTIGVVLLFLPSQIGILWTILISLALAILIFFLARVVAPPKRITEIEIPFYR